LHVNRAVRDDFRVDPEGILRRHRHRWQAAALGVMLGLLLL